jgi:hypothetical protein
MSGGMSLWRASFVIGCVCGGLVCCGLGFCEQESCVVAECAGGTV